MYVIKRNGDKEEVSFDKILYRLKKVSNGLDVNIHEIAQTVCSRIHNGVKTFELDDFAAQMCSSMILEHPDYGILGSRLIISNHQKQTSPSFSETINQLYDNYDFENNHYPLISKELYDIIQENKDKLNSYINYERDFLIDYFGFKTLERAYLLRKNDKILERPQHMWMRVAIGIHAYDIKDALETYDYLSQKFFTHASPTLFNAGTRRPQMSSCFLLDVEDSIKGIYENLTDCAQISKYAGGIGLNVHDIRSKNSVIRGTNGSTDGIIPMLRVYNATARYVNQSSKRLGSIAIYIEPWHGDIFEWLDLRKNHGAEEERARDLFYALWIPDLFMKRVKNNEKWSLMCPDICKGLSTAYGDDFDKLYESYEKNGKYLKQVDAQKIWFKILEAQIETGTPYMLYKDAVNIKSNQKNIGTIKSSNLCCEILEFTSP
jgi:ribonucleotide reductase alpha subunit